jgi:MarR family transcriptional regulator, organic hydroperoxide resistance regulator
MLKHSTNSQRDNLGFLLAKATHRWNDLLYDGFRREGFAQVRPSFGSVLVPLFEEDGLRLGELAKRSRLTKQTMTTMVRAVEAARLVDQHSDPEDGRAVRVWLTAEARQFQPVAELVLEELDATATRAGAATDLAVVRRWLARFADLS